MQLAGSASTPSSTSTGPVARLVAVLAIVAALVSLAACSSSKKNGSTTTTTSSAPGGNSSAPGGSGSAGDTAAITNAYVKLFAADTPLDTSVGLLQDGTDFRATLEAEGKTTYAKEASVTVSKVTVTSANRATVIFSVLLNKSPILPNQTGYAVRENGTWKVAGATFCGLLTAQGNPPKACATPAATSLPI